jgi:hypothetical protein
MFPPDIAVEKAVRFMLERFRGPRSPDRIHVSELRAACSLHDDEAFRNLEQWFLRERFVQPAGSEHWLPSANLYGASDHGRPLTFVTVLDHVRRKAASSRRERFARIFSDGYWASGETSSSITFPFATLSTVVEYGERVDEGRLIELVAPAWHELVRAFERDPALMHQVHHRVWEEMIAGYWKSQGARVTLTPASGDKGVDVIADIGFGSMSFRVIDQVKAYAPDSIVPYETVNGIVGALATDFRGASKCILTTTGRFPPSVLENPNFQALMPRRLVLRDRELLLKELIDASKDDPS